MKTRFAVIFVSDLRSLELGELIKISGWNSVSSVRETQLEVRSWVIMQKSKRGVAVASRNVGEYTRGIKARRVWKETSSRRVVPQRHAALNIRWILNKHFACRRIQRTARQTYPFNYRLP